MEGPSYFATCLRFCWKLQSSQNRYIRGALGADQYIGRTLALLPQTEEFGILPPFFPVADEAVKGALNLVFPEHPAGMRPLLLSCLASLIYHSDFIQDNFSEEHRIFSTLLFDESVLALKERIVCRTSRTGDPFMPTGLPSNVKLMGDMKETREKVEETNERVAELSTTVKEMIPTIASNTAEACRDALEQCAESFGNVTPDAVMKQVSALGASLTSDLSKIMEEKLQIFATPPQVVPIVEECEPAFLEGRWQTFPKDFELVKGNLQVAFVRFVSVCFDFFGRALWWSGIVEIRCEGTLQFREQGALT